MKTTVELPDDLYRRAKAQAALRGRKFKELVEEGLRLMVRLRKQARALKSLKGLGWAGDLDEMRQVRPSRAL